MNFAYRNAQNLAVIRSQDNQPVGNRPFVKRLCDFRVAFQYGAGHGTNVLPSILLPWSILLAYAQLDSWILLLSSPIQFPLYAGLVCYKRALALPLALIHFGAAVGGTGAFGSLRRRTASATEVAPSSYPALDSFLAGLAPVQAGSVMISRAVFVASRGVKTRGMGKVEAMAIGVCLPSCSIESSDTKKDRPRASETGPIETPSQREPAGKAGKAGYQSAPSR